MKINTKFTATEIMNARAYWGTFTAAELRVWWKHYTTGKGKGMYTSVNENTPFFDYIVLSARESEMERILDI